MIRNRTIFHALWLLLCGVIAAPLGAQVAIQPSAPATAKRTLSPDFLGINTRAKIPGFWENDTDQANLRRLGVGHLRFPGGTVGNYYNWTTGALLTPDAPHPHQNQAAENYRLEQLLTAHETTGVEPIYVLNMVTSHRIAGYGSALDSQLAMLHHAKDIGLPVGNIELGNELYATVYDEQAHPLSEVNMQGFLDAPDYYATATQWAQQIKTDFPDVKISLVNTVVRSSDVTNQNRYYDWNRDLAAVDLGDIDAMSMHYYTGAGLINDPDAYNTLAEAQEAQWDRFNSPVGIDQAIGHSFSFMDDVQNNTLPPPEVPQWVTEFNLMDKVGLVARTWTHALFTTAMFFKMLEDPSIEFVAPHSFHGQKFGAVFFHDDEFSYMKLDPDLGYSLTTTPGELSANGHAISFFSQAMEGMTEMSALNATDVPVIGETENDVYNHPALLGYLLENDLTARILLTNFSSQEISVDLTSMSDQLNLADILTAAPRRHILSDADMQRISNPVDGILALPAYSIAIISYVPEPATVMPLLLAILLGGGRRW